MSIFLGEKIPLFPSEVMMPNVPQRQKSPCSESGRSSTSMAAYTIIILILYYIIRMAANIPSAREGTQQPKSQTPSVLFRTVLLFFFFF